MKKNQEKAHSSKLFSANLLIIILIYSESCKLGDPCYKIYKHLKTMKLTKRFKPCLKKIMRSRKTIYINPIVNLVSIKLHLRQHSLLFTISLMHFLQRK